MKTALRSILFIGFGALLLTACQPEQPAVKSQPKVDEVQITVPDFNADSAFEYVRKQTEFGPRIPGSAAHAACANYFVDFFKSIKVDVQVQEFKARTFDNKIYDGKNIIASINPKDPRRVLLCAHWDSRPFADHDADSKNHYTPIDGANDGASGVGVLMEIARQMSISSPTIGIDIVLFDLEDYGQHAEAPQVAGSENTWCLGSQYWAKNPHIAGYTARYGVLLDMVGAENAVFGKEYYSKNFAPGVLDKVWRTAKEAGYGAYFKDQDGGVVLDDHVFINKYAYIPTIDIIHYNGETGSGFFPHWHTLEDNIDKIDPLTLKAVGQTVLRLTYYEK
jgi:Zn-dependent M28 family amino/carboxypeptidase